MRYLWPGEPHDVDDAELERLYTYPPGRKWLAVNFVSSADGAVEVHGRAAALSNEPDRRVLRLGSDLADVLLVGASTAVIEEFRGMHPDALTARRRETHGLREIAPTAVVTTGQSLPEHPAVITEARTPTIVFTCAAAPERKRKAWAEAGATVLITGEYAVDLRTAVETLADLGLHRIDCEGGPHLFGSLIEKNLVDELRLTVSPMLVAGTAERIALGAGAEPTSLELASMIAEDDTVLMRYLVRRG